MSSPFKGITTFFPHRIWQQIFILLVFLVVTPLVVLGFLLTRTSQNAIEPSIQHYSQEVALHTTGEIKENIKGAQQALYVVASILGTLHADSWRQETSIVELALQYPIFRRVASVDVKGQEIATSQLGTPLRNRSEELPVMRALSGESFISEVAIAQDHIPVLTMAVPIKQLGKITGALIAQVSLRGIWDIIDGMKFGKTGKAYLIDHQGRIIAHPDKKLVLKGTPLVPTTAIKDILAGRIKHKEEVDAQGKLKLISYAPIELLNWCLIVEQSGGEVYAFAKAMKMQSWILIFLSILATVMISLILSRWMSYPINRLMQGTQQLVKGSAVQPFRIRRRDEIGKLMFSFNRMISKLRKAQEKEKLSIVGKAATAIAHELKNSLVMVNTFIRLLPERHKDKKFVDEFSQTIPKELDSWNTVLQNMMEFSRFNHLSMTELDINALVLEVTALAKWRFQQKNITFHTRLQKDIPVIIGNADKLKQVLINLVNNSVEATSVGGEIDVETSLTQGSYQGGPRYAQIKVTNTGEGIAQDQIDKIFDPFYTTKKSGLGLGLSISKEIIEYHKGSIQVLNEQDQKTSFIIKIPTKISVFASN